jgi:FkbM family methyltransferase
MSKFSKLNSALYTDTFSPINVLAQRAYLSAARRAKANREFLTYWGDRIQGDIGDYIQARLFSFGVWEPNLSRFIQGRIKPDTWAVDIGAHVGYFSLLMSRLAPQGHVKAIEASPTTFRQLCEHLELNRAFNVTAINQAVTASPGIVKLYNSKWGAGNTGNNSLIAPNEDAPSVTVPADTLMGTIGGNYAKRVSFIKMDVEGAERPILEEIITNRDLFAERLTIVAEVSDDNLDLVDRFLSAGFKCSVLDNHYGLDAYLSKRTAKPRPWAGERHPSADLIFER